MIRDALLFALPILASMFLNRALWYENNHVAYYDDPDKDYDIPAIVCHVLGGVCFIAFILLAWCKMNMVWFVLSFTIGAILYEEYVCVRQRYKIIGTSGGLTILFSSLEIWCLRIVLLLAPLGGFVFDSIVAT
jgi:hypothetical protein